MLKITQELSGIALNYAIAIAEGVHPMKISRFGNMVYKDSIDDSIIRVNPIENVEQAFEILKGQTFRITAPKLHNGATYWDFQILGKKYLHNTIGDTMLEAAMRGYAIMKLGGEVDIPEEYLVIKP